MNPALLARKPIVAALVVFAVALPAFLLLSTRSEPRPAISRSDAVAIARADPQVRKALAPYGRSSARVTVLDTEHQRVGFFQGSRLVLVALVGPNRTVTAAAPGGGFVGNRIANSPALLVGLALVFILVLATVPVVSPRNLDVLVFACFTVAFWLTGRGLLDASLLLAYPLLGYLAFRFLWMAAHGSKPEARTSLYWRLTEGWSLMERRRVLRLVAGGLAALTAILTVTSSGVSDVAFASLAGATDLIHGTAPYGHIPDFIIHGDTYPPLNYVVYLPGAAVMPVTDAFSDPQGALLVTALATLLTAGLIYRLLARASDGGTSEDLLEPGREPADLTGLRAATAWLAFPPVLLAASSGSNDIVLALCLVAVFGSLASARRSTVLLGVAAWVKLTPVVALPVWIARMGRRQALQTISVLAILSAGILGGLVALEGPGSISSMVDAMSFQFERRSLFTLLPIGTGLGPLQAVGQALLVSAVVGMTLAVRRDPALREDPIRLAAMLTALLLLSQLAANYWSWAYMPWVIAPALLVLVPAMAPSPVPSAADVSRGIRVPRGLPVSSSVDASSTASS